MPDQRLVLHSRPAKSLLLGLLAAAGLQEHQDPGRDSAGEPVRRRSGFVIGAPTDDPCSWRISYVHHEGDEVSEARFHDQIRAVLCDGGLEAEQVDAPACRNVAVLAHSVRPLTDADWALLHAVRHGRITRLRGAWQDSGALDGAQVDTTAMPELLANALVSVAVSQPLATLTVRGETLLASPVSGGAPTVDLSEFA